MEYRPSDVWFSSKHVFWCLPVASHGLAVLAHFKKWGVCFLWKLCEPLPITDLSLRSTVETG